MKINVPIDLSNKCMTVPPADGACTDFISTGLCSPLVLFKKCTLKKSNQLNKFFFN